MLTLNTEQRGFTLPSLASFLLAMISFWFVLLARDPLGGPGHLLRPEVGEILAAISGVTSFGLAIPNILRKDHGRSWGFAFSAFVVLLLALLAAHLL